MIPLPPQPPDVPWPTEEWTRAELDPEVDREGLKELVDAAFAAPSTEAFGETHSTVVIHRGRLVLERYGDGLGPAETLPSWSMAKSVLQAAVGIAVARGKMDLNAPVNDPAWAEEGDPRAAITLDQLLRMSSGLEFLEDYVDSAGSDAIRMLFGPGKADVAGYAAAKPLEAKPDTVFSYSSGTTNIICAALGRAIGEPVDAFVRREILDRIGMRSAEPRIDDAGHWIASSFLFATAQDFARFGLLYLRDGIWEGERVLPEGWVDYARTPTPTSPEREYGAHWWLSTDGSATFSANGYRGQYIVLSPERDIVVVRHGASEPDNRGAVFRYLRDIIQSFPTY